MAHSMYVAESSPLMVMMSMGHLVFGGAIGTDSLDHKVNGFSLEAVG